ncbi:MAG TPA: aminotransferase class I/II-fold pyridoxal phosphate-dependent enzyme [Myxococcaceae bacterium]|nr:aminotransferase class I/II-fold pyridoxal phosphate-dependent enzyme [Myxococcaceae bacterium]
MEISLHRIEPWLIKHQYARFNLAESGMVNQTVGQLMDAVGLTDAEMRAVSLANSDTHGMPALREAVAALYPGVSPDEILITTGTSEALLLYYHVRSRPGARAVVPIPAFQSLDELPRYLGYEVTPFRLERAIGFRPDVEALERAIDERTVTVVLNSPQNPTGIVFTPDEVRRTVARARAVGAEVLADEHYRFVPFGEHDELLPSIVSPNDGIVGVGSMIKCFGCVGLRIGWLIGPKALVEACRDLKDYTTHTVCGMNELLAARVLTNFRPLGRQYRGWVRQNVAEFSRFADRHASLLGWVRPEGGLVCFPWLRDAGLDSQRFAQRLVEQTEVFVLPGDTFGYPGHFRLGFGLEPKDFAAALDRWDGFLTGRRWE